MLGRVSESETALQYAYDELEDRVAQRTIQLRQEIAERRKTEEDLVRAVEATEAASLAKSEFLANMSHEIRTPLNSILGFTDLLQRGADHGNPDAKEEYLMTIRSSGQHLLELINDILDLSKVEAGRLEIDREQCSPHKIISEIISLTSISAVEKNLDLRYRWESSVPATICTDASRLKQLLLNLIGNAIKFTDVGGVMVSVRLDQQVESSKLKVTIADTGVGVPKDKLESIFDPFVQVDASMTRRHGGTGLGLAIARRLAVAMGGGLEIESVVGEGSTFTVTIDAGSMLGVEMYDAPEADALVGLNKAAKSSVSPNALRGVRILLVEDGHTNRKVIGLMLEQAGAKVEMAENGKLGIEAVQHHPFDVILMDMQMPVMDGYTAASILRQDGVKTPIVALTAHAMKGDRAKCLEAGCVDYLPKPIGYDQLTSALSKAIQLHENGSSDRPEQEAAPLSETVGDQNQDNLSEMSFSPQTGLHSDLQTIINNDTQRDMLELRTIRSTLPIDNPTFAEIVVEFVDHLFQRIAEMRQFAEQQDEAELRRMAHWLKGTAGMAGFTEFTDWADQLHGKAADQQWPVVIRLIDQIEEVGTLHRTS